MTRSHNIVVGGWAGEFIPLTHPYTQENQKCGIRNARFTLSDSISTDGPANGRMYQWANRRTKPLKNCVSATTKSLENLKMLQFAIGLYNFQVYCVKSVRKFANLFLDFWIYRPSFFSFTFLSRFYEFRLFGLVLEP